jgi:hypothetical protein
MGVEVTPADVSALNEKVIVCRYFTHPDGTPDYWIKGSLKDILDYFVPEGSSIVDFDVSQLERELV